MFLKLIIIKNSKGLAAVWKEDDLEWTAAHQHTEEQAEPPHKGTQVKTLEYPNYSVFNLLVSSDK